MNIMQRFLGGVSTTIAAVKTYVGTGAIFAPGTVATGITAHSGGGQTNATALTAWYNRVDTVAVAADSVKLPAPSYTSQIVAVMNNTANATQVFGSGTDTINGVATATGVSLAAGKMALYVAETIGTAASWRELLSA